MAYKLKGKDRNYENRKVPAIENVRNILGNSEKDRMKLLK